MQRVILSICIFLTIFSCNRKFSNSDILLDDNSDTLYYIQRYPNKEAVREIIYYCNNKPERNIGFSEKGDTLKSPSIIFLGNGDSLFAFYPIGQYRNAVIVFNLDSAKAVLGKWKDCYLVDCRSSLLLKIIPEMQMEKKRLYGAFKCENPDGTFEYWPFDYSLK